jgi:glyoxylase-like metal-dependent hydrolase (beta-lactamase superfamily II)
MGYRSSAEIVARDLAAHGIRKEDLHYLLPTHVHLDHCGSCGTLANLYPEASVRVHPRGLPHVSDPARLVAGAMKLFGEELVRRFRLPDPISLRRTRGVSDDEEIALGNALTLRAIWTPGHAPHHISYFLEDSGTLFTGDAVGVRYPPFPILIPTSPPPSFNFQKAIASLERLRALSPKRLCTPHFGVLENANERFAQDLDTLLSWKDQLQRLASQKSSVSDIVRVMTNEICERALQTRAKLPEYLQTTIRLSVLGLLAYLEWDSNR